MIIPIIEYIAVFQLLNNGKEVIMAKANKLVTGQIGSSIRRYMQTIANIDKKILDTVTIAISCLNQFEGFFMSRRFKVFLKQ